MEPRDDNESKIAKIENFRHAAGIQNVYRCASTDVLADALSSDSINWAHPDRFVFEEAGLIVDLRSPVERNEENIQKWTSATDGMKVIDTDYPSNVALGHIVPEGNRYLVRVNVMSKSRFLPYIEENWFNAKEKRKAAFFKKFNDLKMLHALRMKKLNERGLYGLNQVILEPGKEELCKALKTITVHLERNPNDNCIIHCVQGKDRTGMLVMLLQSILGFPDSLIIDDYFLSNGMIGASAAAATVQRQPTKPGRMDRKVFAGASREAMIETLSFLRTKYGSVAPGYTDHIGFDNYWRKRLIAVLQPSNFKRTSSL